MSQLRIKTKSVKNPKSFKYRGAEYQPSVHGRRRLTRNTWIGAGVGSLIGTPFIGGPIGAVAGRRMTKKWLIEDKQATRLKKKRTR